MEFSADLKFLDQVGDNQNIQVIIDDKKSGQHISEKLKIGEAYVFENYSDEIKPYILALDKTVFSIGIHQTHCFRKFTF